MSAITQLSADYAAKAAAVAQAPATPEKEQLIIERNAAATAYFRARYEQQRQNLSRIQR
jgi:hypothetical protein